MIKVNQQLENAKTLELMFPGTHLPTGSRSGLPSLHPICGQAPHLAMQPSKLLSQLKFLEGCSAAVKVYRDCEPEWVRIF